MKLHRNYLLGLLSTLALSLLTACGSSTTPTVNFEPAAPNPNGDPCTNYTPSQANNKPLVAKLNPAKNAEFVSNSSLIEAYFTHKMQAANDSNFTVQGFQTSKLSGAYAGGGSDVLSFNPNATFKPGEEIEVTLTKSLLSQKLDPGFSGRGNKYQPLCKPFVYRFRAKSESTGPNNGTIFSTLGYSIPAEIADTIVGEFNNDGNLDIAVVDQKYGQLIIFFGRGDGSFCELFSNELCYDYRFYEVGSSPKELVTRDFNNDGWLDIAVANEDGGSDQVTVLSGGVRGFSKAVYGTNFDITTLDAGDINADGKADIVVQNYSGAQQAVLINTGSGFQVTSDFAVEVPAVALGDVNGDGALDKIIAYPDPNQNQGIKVALGDNKGSFSSYKTYAFSARPLAIVTADFNGDGYLDVATANYGALNQVTLALNNGSGEFTNPIHFSIAFPPPPSNLTGWGSDIEVADLNADSHPDLVVTLGAGSIGAVVSMISDGQGGFNSNLIGGVASPNQEMTVGDFDNDGDVDIVNVANLGTMSRMQVLLNQP